MNPDLSRDPPLASSLPFDCLSECGGPESPLLFAHADTISADKGDVKLVLHEMSEAFGRWLQGHLDRKRWKQADLVHATGASRTAVSDWVNGNKLPDPISAKKIASALDASAEEAFRVLGWLDTPTSLTPAQADLIETIRRRNISDMTAQTCIAVINQLEPKE